MILGELLVIVGDDRELVELLVDAEVLPPPLERDYSADEAELARIARVLVRELEVNVAGVEVILRLRDELLAMRRQMGEVIQTFQDARRGPS